MVILLSVMVFLLLLLNYIQRNEIKKLKSLFDFNETELQAFAKEKLAEGYEEVKTIKLLRERYYPLDLVTAKNIVDKAKNLNEF